LIGSSSVTDPFTPELDLPEAEVVTIVLARVGSSAGACLLGTAVISTLRTGLGTVEVHQAVADRSGLVLARFASSSVTAACGESSTLRLQEVSNLEISLTSSFHLVILDSRVDFTHRFLAGTNNLSTGEHLAFSRVNFFAIDSLASGLGLLRGALGNGAFILEGKDSDLEISELINSVNSVLGDLTVHDDGLVLFRGSSSSDSSLGIEGGPGGLVLAHHGELVTRALPGKVSHIKVQLLQCFSNLLGGMLGG